MDYRKSKAPVNTTTRNIMDLCEETGNIYESVAIISKRANQIAAEIKQDLNKKLAEFASYNDSLEESRSKSHVITRNCLNQHCWQHRNLLTEMFIGVIRLRKIRHNDTA